MATFNDEKKQKFSANSGTTGTLPDVTNAYLEQLTSPTGLATEEDKWKLQLNNLGYSGYDWQTNLFNYLGDIGYTGAWNDRFRDWLIDGGSFGPTVLIQLNSGGSCDYIDPDTTCLASGTYEANDFGFTNPANSWVWSIVSGAAAIQGSTTEKTVVVTTNDVGADVDFVLKVIATDTVSTDSAERESALKQDHDNVTEAPAYIGPNINDRDYTVDVPITPVDTFNLFTGDALVFTLEGTWPTGLVIDSASGQITGTPTGALQPYPNLFVRVTNSKGFADSTQLTITLTSSAVAPIFDNGPVPDQDWPIDQAIAQFPIGQFFLTGSFPRTYTIESGAFPTGITMNTAGQINGTPTVEGETGSVVIRCTNSAGFALTNEWDWLTWEAVAFAGPIPAQTATIGVEYTHDYSQYFTGTVSDYVINTASWPPGTVLDANTGIVTFTPAVEFSGTNALIIANSDYTPAFVLSNNFAWDVTDASAAFYALTPDPVTKKLLGVRTGTGGLTTSHTSTLYAPDQDGIYRPFFADNPVYSGGRVVSNILIRSQEFDNSAWSNDFGGCSKTANTDVAPDGTTTADTVTGTGTNVNIRTTQSNVELIGGNNQVYSVYAKQGTNQFIRLWADSLSGALNNSGYFDLATGTATGAGASMTDVGNGWWRCEQAFTVGTDRIGNFRIHVTPSNVASTWPTVGEAAGKSVILWGAQLEEGTVASEYVETAATKSSAVYANDAPNGTPLADIPYLQYYPAAENELLHSRDFANATNWTPTGCTAVADAVGLDGTPNTGVTVTGTGNTSDKINPSSIAGTIQSTGVLYYRKTGTDATHVLFQPHQSQWVEFNPQDGTEIHTQGIASWDWIDQGDVVKVVVEANGGVDSIYNVYPNRSGGAASIVLLQMERHIGKSIAEVRDVSPVFTTTAAVAVDRTNYPYDSANSSDGTSAWYCEVTSEGAQDVIDGFLSVTGTNWQLSDGTTTVTRPWTAGTEHQVGIAYGDGQMSIKVDATWSADVAYDGTMLQGILDLFRAGAFGGKMRELQRFDAADYAAAQAIINGLIT